MKLPAIKFGSAKMVIIFACKILAAIIGIVFVPVYVNYLGDESYGLVAFYGTLSGSLVILDVGLSSSVARQVSFLRALPGKEKEIKDLVFSVEVLNWAIGLFAGILIILLATPISRNWVNAESIPLKVIEQSVMLMGVLFAVQFPSSVYDGVMIASEKQVSNVLINISFIILKALGVIIVLKFISNTIVAFFIWQVTMTFLLSITMRAFVWRRILNWKIHARFSTVQLKSIKSFAFGVAGISIIAFLFAQLDKVIVSKMVTLRYVGYYNIACLLAGAITLFVSAMQPVVSPRFTALVAQNKTGELVEFYHKISRWLAIIVIPTGLIIIFFAREILMLWTRNTELTDYTTPVLQASTAGVILNSLLSSSQIYMLASGKTRLILLQSIIATVLFIPSLFYFIQLYGAFGAGLVWAGLNLLYVLFYLPLFHKYFLKNELMNWYSKDIAVPLISSIIVIGGAKILKVNFFSEITIVGLGVLTISALLIYSLIIPELRRMLITRIRMA